MSELENQYSSLFGTKTSKGQLRGGFAFITAGALLGLAALVLFISAQANAADKTTYYNLMRLALTCGAAGAAFFLIGFTVALPTTTPLRVAAWVGFACTMMAGLMFFVHYPGQFNVAVKGATTTDYMPIDVGLFFVGAFAMIASNVASIVGFYLSRATGTAKAEGDDDDETYGPGYEVPDWVVERDIEYAMKKFGVEVVGGKGSASAGMKVNINDSFGANMVVGGLGKARTVQLDSTQVDEGVTQLSGVRPNKKGALPGEWADESTKALIAFRKQKTANPTMYVPKKRSFWSRIFGGRSKAAAPTVTMSSAPSKASVPTNGNTGKFVGRGKTVVIEDESPARGKKGGST